MILAFGGILVNMTIQSMAECLGIAKSNHSSFHQSTLVLFSLISFDVSAYTNLGDEDHKALSSYFNSARNSLLCRLSNLSLLSSLSVFNVEE